MNVVRNIALSCLASILLLSSITEVEAKQTRRDAKWEATFQMLNSLSTDIDGKGGSGIEIDSDLGWGFTLGYNLNEHVLLNFEFQSTSPDYKATFVPEDDSSSEVISAKMDSYHSQFNAIYNLSTEQFTPFVQAGIGWSFTDSNIADGPPSGGCWYDPWWGYYYCDTYQNTYDKTSFSYNLAAGFRYELDNSLFFRASYKQQWVDMGNSDNMSIGIVSLEVGSIF